MIDFHCHLDLYPDPSAVIKRCVEKRLYVLSVTTTPSAWSGTSALAGSYNRIRTALGFHPQLVQQRRAELRLFEQILPDTRYVGEVGLDGSPELKSSWEDQLVVFDRILALCQEQSGRVMSIHSRRAAKPVLDAIAKFPGAGIPILHWFSGGVRDLDRAISMGCWFSVGPAMLAGERGRALVMRMPRERVLTETDGPFAQVRGASAMPWDVEDAIDRLAELWQLPVNDVIKRVEDNIRTIGEQFDAKPAINLSPRHVQEGSAT